MFGKKNEEFEEVKVQVSDGNVIEENTTFKGDLATKSPLLIKGVFDGRLDSTSSVVVEATGMLKGTANMCDLTVSGVADGEIQCTNSTKITSTGRLSGSLATARLITDDGSTFDGKLEMLQPKKPNIVEE